MNPFLSLLIVLVLIVLSIKLIYWFYNSISLRQNSFLKKNHLFKTTDIKVISTHLIDDKYKVAVIKINNQQKTVLLGPTSAIILNEESIIANVSEKIESIAS